MTKKEYVEKATKLNFYAKKAHKAFGTFYEGSEKKFDFALYKDFDYECGWTSWEPCDVLEFAQKYKKTYKKCPTCGELFALDNQIEDSVNDWMAQIACDYYQLVKELFEDGNYELVNDIIHYITKENVVVDEDTCFEDFCDDIALNDRLYGGFVDEVIYIPA